MFSNILKILLRSANASAKSFTVNFLEALLFLLLSFSFFLFLLQLCIPFLFLFPTTPHLVNSTGTTSRGFSMPSSSTLRLKLCAISTTTLLIFATSSFLANHLKSWANLLSISFQMPFILSLVTLPQAKARILMCS